MKAKLTKLTVLIPFLLFVVNIDQGGAVIYPCISDVYIDGYAPDENMNFRTRILISYHPSKGIARGLFKFDIPEEIDPSDIMAATLYLSGSYHTGGGYAINVNCYTLNEPFSEGSDTWNTLSGGDHDSIVSSGSLPAGDDWEASIDVTALAIGNLEKLRNNGMLIKLQNESGISTYQNIASRECIDPQDFAPYLDIEFSEISSSSTTSEPVETSTSSSLITSSTSSIDDPLTTTSTIQVSSTTTTLIEETTTIVTTSSTTTSSFWPCPVEIIYGEESDEVLILRYLRDHGLQATPQGRELVQLYYAWSPFIVRMIEKDPELQYELRDTLDELLHIILND